MRAFISIFSVPICYRAIDNQLFNQLAQQVSANGQFLPAFFQPLVDEVISLMQNPTMLMSMRQFQGCSAKFGTLEAYNFITQNAGGNFMVMSLTADAEQYNEFVAAVTQSCGWSSIKEDECILRGCCWNEGSGTCENPLGNYIAPERVNMAMQYMMYKQTYQTTNQNSASVNQYTFPSNQNSVLTTENSVPTNESSVSTNDNSVPTTQNSVPTNETSVPTNDNSVPITQNSVPTPQKSVPINENSVPTNETSVPTVQNSVPTNENSVPTNETSVTTNKNSVPMNENSVPTTPPSLHNTESIGGIRPMPAEPNTGPPSEFGYPISRKRRAYLAGFGSMRPPFGMGTSSGRGNMGGVFGSSTISHNGICASVNVAKNCMASSTIQNFNVIQKMMLEGECAAKGCCWDNQRYQQTIFMKSETNAESDLFCAWRIPDYSIYGLPSLSHSLRGCCDYSPCVQRVGRDGTVNTGPGSTGPVQPPSPEWSPWGGWSICSVSCGTGKSVRDRSCLTPDSMISNSCQGSHIESQNCYTNCEPVIWSAWTSYGCSRTCGGGYGTAFRSCISGPCPTQQEMNHNQPCNQHISCGSWAGFPVTTSSFPWWWS